MSCLRPSPTFHPDDNLYGGIELSFTTIASWPLLVWKALVDEGINPRPLFEEAGIDPALFDRAGARYPVAHLQRLWHQAAKVSAAPCLGIATARHWHPTTLHALGIAWLASPTLAEAYQRVVRHSAVVTTLGTAHLDLTRGRYTFSVVAADPEFHAQPEAAHAALAVLVRMCRMSLSEGFQPLQVRLRHDRSDCDQALRDYFGCPIEYGTERYGLVMAAADLDRQLPTASIELLTNAEQMIADYLGPLDHDDTVARAKAEILRQLPSGRITEETIAAALNMSLRTFQRRLNDRNTVYRELLESVRRDLALKYIATPRLSITEISYLLGFSEPSSFARTFRRWTGKSPSQQRQRAV